MFDDSGLPAEQLARHKEPLDLIGALINLRHLGIPHHSLHRIILM